MSSRRRAAPGGWAWILVAGAIALMIGLGFWQIERGRQKARLLEQYRSAQAEPEITLVSVPSAGAAPLFRRARLDCARVLKWESVSGRDLGGRSGWVHRAYCGLGNGEIAVDIGWSNGFAKPDWRGGPVAGWLAPMPDGFVRLIADRAPPRLDRVAPPDPASLPNNHTSYAIQWFTFAAIALVIAVLAGRRGRAAAMNRDQPG